jgi:hypothetical protein
MQDDDRLSVALDLEYDNQRRDERDPSVVASRFAFGTGICLQPHIDGMTCGSQGLSLVGIGGCPQACQFVQCGLVSFDLEHQSRSRVARTSAVE